MLKAKKYPDLSSKILGPISGKFGSIPTVVQVVMSLFKDLRFAFMVVGSQAHILSRFILLITVKCSLSPTVFVISLLKSNLKVHTSH